MNFAKFDVVFDRFRATGMGTSGDAVTVAMRNMPRTGMRGAEFNIPEGEELIAVPGSLLADHVGAVRA
jgi:hypothetical protein